MNRVSTEQDVDLDFFGEDIPLEYDRDKLPDQKLIKPGSSSRSKKQPNHNQRVIKYWSDKGYRVENMQGWRNINGAFVSADFCGCWDFLLLKAGRPPILLQVCAKGAVRGHWRKMLGDLPDPQQRPRRQSVEYYRSIGWKIAMMWFDQPGGHGKAWENGVEWLTEDVIASIDGGRRMKR